MKVTLTRSSPFAVVVLSAFLFFNGPVFAGSLEPTSPPGPTMKTLDEIEPGIPISQEDLPLVIDQPGTYYLTENLQYNQTLGTAISINYTSAVLDMNGYTLRGMNTGTAHGVATYRADAVEIRNGSVSNFSIGVFGDFFTDNCRLTDLNVSGNINRGISLGGGHGNLVRRCTASFNGQAGIYAYSSTTITECMASNNAGQGITGGISNTVRNCIVKDNKWRGIAVGDHSIIEGNTCMNNIDVGIYVGKGSVVRGNCVKGSSVHGIAVTYGCTVTNNTAYENGNIGIHGGNGGTIIGNTAYGNQNFGIAGAAGCLISDNTSRNNVKDGIYAGNDCTVKDNNCFNNGLEGDGAGIRALSNNRIQGNHVTGNDRGIDIDSTGNLIVQNSARSNTTAYTIVGGNTVGSITSDPTTAGPWANFSY
ncbi:hypothetical protein STSP2_00118 [Anaerohalosphaera lusitana]|uniref:Right handed beta helix domain-containing protein n=1 Tax=Anaerohalosphaera lusitana TaxID=1936003 RepID=A0A1U9NH99_9BACT|nr:right-handed parallel beta-helix repeat-containing protein [Anaerohalosphaera lusitana]AQT66980.1 hypothetical protein STSP2_00118 [Anaerohalosphaera lusitana]